LSERCDALRLCGATREITWNMRRLAAEAGLAGADDDAVRRMACKREKDDVE